MKALEKKFSMKFMKIAYVQLTLIRKFENRLREKQRMNSNECESEIELGVVRQKRCECV